MDFAQRFEGINWKIYVRLMNRFRKTGSYFKPEGAHEVFQEIVAAAESAAVMDDYGNYGNDNYGNDYEGGE